MVDIECSRCGAMGVDYPTVYVAKFTLVHRQGCGAKIGIPNYFIGKTKPTIQDVEPVIHAPDKNEKLFSDVTKIKKKKSAKKKFV
ncbi:MAG: hypothetical protein V3T88_00260 [Nitrosomonadaceae bacterium]